MTATLNLTWIQSLVRVRRATTEAIKRLYCVCMKRFTGQRINGNVSSRMELYQLVARIGSLTRQVVSSSGKHDQCSGSVLFIA